MSDKKFLPQGDERFLPKAVEQLISDSIWHIDGGRFFDARLLLVRALEDFGDPDRD